MKVNELLNEETVGKKKPKKQSVKEYTELKKLLDTHCKEGLSFLKNNTGLFRGMTSEKSDFMIADYSQGERTSQNTKNTYTVIFDNSPDYADYPKRSKSMICTNSARYARAFGGNSSYAVIPFDGTKIAVCPKLDIWETPVKKITAFKRDFTGKMSLVQYSEVLSYSFGVFSEKNKLSEFKQKIATYLDKQKKNKSPWDFRYKFTKTNVDDILQNIYDDLTPEKLGFRLMTIPEFSKTFKNSVTNFGHTDRGSNECWFSGPCIAIRQPIFLDLINGYKNGNF